MEKTESTSSGPPLGEGADLKRQIATAHKLLDDLIAQPMQALGLTIGEADLLTVLLIALPHHAAPTELAEWLRMTTAGVVGRLNSLEHKRLVERKRHVSDGRRIEVHLTHSGRELAERVLQSKDTVWSQPLARDLGLERAHVLITGLKELNRILAQASPDLDAPDTTHG